MIRRGVGVAAGVVTAAGVGVTAGAIVATGVPAGAGMRPGAGGVAVATAVRVVVAEAPATAVPVGTLGIAAVGEAVGAAAGAVALAVGVGEGAEDVDGADGVERSNSARTVASCSAASRARRDSSARATPSHEPASTASEVAATNKLTSVRRTSSSPAAFGRVTRSGIWEGAVVPLRWRPPAASVSRMNDTVLYSVWSGVGTRSQEGVDLELTQPGHRNPPYAPCMRILVAEDDVRLARLVERGLTAEGHEVQVAHDGEEALFFAREAPPDLIVMDVMMPRIDGFEAVRRLRAEHLDTPVIFLTARGQVEDRVKGLDIGGDDYLVKPFAFDELTARVRALGRRAAGAEGDLLHAGGVTLDVRRHEAKVDDNVVDLSPTEYRLLEHLMRHTGQALTRQAILSAVWGFDAEPEPNAVDLYVHYLRRKLGDAVAIATVRGVGYRLDRDV